MQPEKGPPCNLKDRGPSLVANRIDMVLGILARKGYRSVSDLAEDLHVSEMTVRRYLDKLEAKELIKRTHGGAFAGQEMIEVDSRVRETIVLQTLENRTNIDTILLGGRVHAASHSLIGPIAEETVAQLRFTKAFLGAVGINLEEGLTQSNVDEVPVKKRVAANSKEVIVLADSSKFNRDVLVPAAGG